MIGEREVKEALGRVINSPHKELIVDTIMQYLTGSNKSLGSTSIDNMSKALMGVVPTVPFKLFDKVWVKVHDLPTWRMDLVRMRAEKLIFQDKVQAVVCRADPYMAPPVEITYYAYKLGEKDLSLETWGPIYQSIIPRTEEIDLSE